MWAETPTHYNLLMLIKITSDINEAQIGLFIKFDNNISLGCMLSK